MTSRRWLAAALFALLVLVRLPSLAQPAGRRPGTLRVRRPAHPARRIAVPRRLGPEAPGGPLRLRGHAGRLARPARRRAPRTCCSTRRHRGGLLVRSGSGVRRAPAAARRPRCCSSLLANPIFGAARGRAGPGPVRGVHRRAGHASPCSPRRRRSGVRRNARRPAWACSQASGRRPGRHVQVPAPRIYGLPALVVLATGEDRPGRRRAVLRRCSRAPRCRSLAMLAVVRVGRRARRPLPRHLHVQRLLLGRDVSRPRGTSSPTSSRSRCATRGWTRLWWLGGLGAAVLVVLSSVDTALLRGPGLDCGRLHRDRRQRQPRPAAVLRAGVAGTGAGGRAGAGDGMAADLAGAPRCRWSRWSPRGSGASRPSPRPPTTGCTTSATCQAGSRARRISSRFGERASGDKYSALAIDELAALPARELAPADRVLVFGFSPGGPGRGAARQRDPLLLEPPGHRRVQGGRRRATASRACSRNSSGTGRRSSCCSATTGTRTAPTRGRSSWAQPRLAGWLQRALPARDRARATS